MTRNGLVCRQRAAAHSAALRESWQGRQRFRRRQRLIWTKRKKLIARNADLGLKCFAAA